MEVAVKGRNRNTRTWSRHGQPGSIDPDQLMPLAQADDVVDNGTEIIAFSAAIQSETRC